MVTKRDFSMMSAEAGNLSLARITVESSDGGRGGFAGGEVYACMHIPCTNLQICITQNVSSGWAVRGEAKAGWGVAVAVARSRTGAEVLTFGRRRSRTATARRGRNQTRLAGVPDIAADPGSDAGGGSQCDSHSNLSTSTLMR